MAFRKKKKTGVKLICIRPRAKEINLSCLLQGVMMITIVIRERVFGEREREREKMGRIRTYERD